MAVSFKQNERGQWVVARNGYVQLVTWNKEQAEECVRRLIGLPIENTTKALDDAIGKV